MSDKLLKILGLASMVISVGATLLNGFVQDKKMAAEIDEKVNAKLSKNNEVES